VLPFNEVKAKKDELKARNAEWKAQLKTVKALATGLFTELKTACRLPPGTKKGEYCTEGFAAKDARFENGQRVINLAGRLGFSSDFIGPLQQAMADGRNAFDRAESINAGLARHKALEDEAKAVKATIKAIENKRDELVQSAREKISKDQARTVIVERLRELVLETYRAYLRADQRVCIKAVEMFPEAGDVVVLPAVKQGPHWAAVH
jgi:type I restriction enzyme M protein